MPVDIARAKEEGGSVSTSFFNDPKNGTVVYFRLLSLWISSLNQKFFKDSRKDLVRANVAFLTSIHTHKIFFNKNRKSFPPRVSTSASNSNVSVTIPVCPNLSASGSLSLN